MKTVFISGLAYSVDQDQLRDVFVQYGRVLRVTIIHDRETGKSRGFAFIVMEDEDGAQDAIIGLHSAEWAGRRLVARLDDGRRRAGQAEKAQAS